MTWIAASTGGAVGDFDATAYGAGVYVAIGDVTPGFTALVSSTDEGVTWTLRTVPVGHEDFYSGVAFGAGLFVAASRIVGPNMVFITSPDGVAWTGHSTAISGLTDPNEPIIFSCGFHNGLFVVSGSDGSIYTSSDGLTWTQRQDENVNPSGYNQSAYGAGAFVLVGTNTDPLSYPEIVSSTDGVTWVPETSGLPALDNLNGVAFGVGTFSAQGTSGSHVTSVNGTTWVATGPISSEQLFGATYADRFYSVGSNGAVLSSVDGFTWAAETSGTSEDLFGISASSAAVVAVGANATILYNALVTVVTAPNILGLTSSAATTAILLAGFVVGTIDYAYSGTTPANRVLAQSPLAGATGTSGDPLSFTLSLGPPPLLVPDIVGLSEATARIVILAASFTVGAVSRAFSEQPYGTVVIQDPPAGAFAAAGYPIVFTTSLGLITSTSFDVRQTVISQYANSPTILRLVDNMAEYIDPRFPLAEFYGLVWNVDTAIGFGLDIWGRIVGVSRVIPIPGTTGSFGFDNPDVPPDWENFGTTGAPGVGGPFYAGQVSTGGFTLDDNAYRVLILTKALANIVATTAPSLNRLITNLFPGRGRAYTQDLGNMAMRYVFEFSLSTVEYAILAYSGVLPHPAGVRVSILVTPASGNFGFHEAGPSAKPFNFGVFRL